MTKKAVILLSGGIDSTTTLYWAKNKGFDLVALIFDYEQRHKKEIFFAKKICKLNEIPYYLQKIKINWVKSSLVNKELKIPLQRNLKEKQIPSTYVSGRNIIFLSYAFSLAESLERDFILIGAHIEDYSGYPDCRPNFLSLFNRAVNLGLTTKIKILSPLINKSKKEILKLGLKLKVPYQFTWSCYFGGKYPCLKCDSCYFRLKGFKELGLEDPFFKIK